MFVGRSIHITQTPWQDSTIDFEKRRNVPVRYNRDLLQTTIKAMKRIGEIKSRRERAFFKNRLVLYLLPSNTYTSHATVYRMAVAREKQRAHRRKKLETATPSIRLHEPMAVESEGQSQIKEKIKVSTKSKSALIPGDGRSMGMDID